VPGLQDRQEVVERRADVAHVDLDVRERRRPDRDDDVLGAGGVGDAVADLEAPGGVDAVHDLLAAVLLERHAPSRTAFSRSTSTSTPSTLSPRSANDIANGSPTRPSPMTETSRSMDRG
jgi:hypothetical protein